MLVNLQERIRSMPRKSLVAVFVLLLLCGWAFEWRNATVQELGRQDSKTLDGRKCGYTASDVEQLMDGLGPEGRTFYAKSELSLDLVYPLLYGFFFAGLIAWLWPSKREAWLLLLPLLAVGADLVENALASYLAWTYPAAASTVLARLASESTVFKWTCARSSIMVVLVGVLAGLARRFRPPPAEGG